MSQAETNAPVRWVSCDHITSQLEVERLREVGMADGAASYQPPRCLREGGMTPLGSGGISSHARGFARL